ASSSAGSRGRPPAREPAVSACSFVAARAWAMLTSRTVCACHPSQFRYRGLPLLLLLHTVLVTELPSASAAPMNRKRPAREDWYKRGSPNEGDRGDGPGCGNGRDDTGGAARAAGSDQRRHR